MAHLPLVCLRAQLLIRQGNLRIALRKLCHDPEVFLLGRLGEADGHAEAGHQGQLFLHGIRAVHTVVLLHVAAVAPGLPDDVAPVGGSVDQHIVRLRLHAALDDRLQVLVLDLELLKGQIVHINDKAVVPVLDMGNHRGEILELMLIDLNHPQALVIVFVQDRLDACGLSGSAVPEQQHVVGRKSLHKGFRVIHQLLLLDLVADQVVQNHLLRIVDGQELHIVLVSLDTEGLIQAEHAHSVGLIEIRDNAENLLLVRSRLDLPAHRLHLFADVFIIHALLFPNRPVMADGGKAVDLQIPLDRAEIKIKQVFKYPEIPLREMIDAAVVCPHLLAGHTEGILVSQENKGQVIVPQILVKPIHGRQIEKSLHLLIDPRGQLRLRAHAVFIILKNTGKLPQDAVLPQIPVQNQLRDFLVHSPFRLLPCLFAYYNPNRRGCT